MAHAEFMQTLIMTLKSFGLDLKHPRFSSCISTFVDQVLEYYLYLTHRNASNVRFSFALLQNMMRQEWGSERVQYFEDSCYICTFIFLSFVLHVQREALELQVCSPLLERLFSFIIQCFLSLWLSFSFDSLGLSLPVKGNLNVPNSECLCLKRGLKTKKRKKKRAFITSVKKSSGIS